MYFSAPTCQRRSPILNVVLMASLVGALILLVNALSRTAHGQEISYQRSATVFIQNTGGTGSGVCVSPDGVIVTAAHVIYIPAPQKLLTPRGAMTLPTAVEVTFPNRQPESARVLAVSKVGEPTDVAILKCSGSDYPALRLAEASPAVGDSVVSMGYPAGLFAQLDGRVTYVGMTDNKSFDCITALGRPQPGHSGGPLIDARGQVVGIACKATIDVVDICGRVKLDEQIGFYARVESVHQLMATKGIATQFTAANRPQKRTRSTGKIKVTIWYQKPCTYCDSQKLDFDNRKIMIKGRVVNDFVEARWKSIDEFPQEAAAARIEKVPTTVFDDTGDRIEGYLSADDFAAKVSVKLGPRLVDTPVDLGPPGLFEPLPNEREPVIPPPEPQPRPETNSDQAATPTTIDGTGLRVVLLVKKQDLSFWQGTAAAAAEKFAEKGLKNRINTALDGKAEIVVCFERTSPGRFADLVEVTGSDKEKNAALIVLAPKTFDGLAGTVASVIEGKLKKVTDGDWKRATVQTIFEREDPEDYDAVIEALDESEPVDQAGSDSILAYVITAITSALAGIRDAMLGHKLKVAKA